MRVDPDVRAEFREGGSGWRWNGPLPAAVDSHPDIRKPPLITTSPPRNVLRTNIRLWLLSGELRSGMCHRKDKNMASIWSNARFPETGASTFADPNEHRSHFQRDYDRLLFSTPVRRLSDKTQVWPMDENDGVRTRLTHSHEVANLAKSIGTRIYEKAPGLFTGVHLYDVVQPILSSIGLVHDLGNPPFGHQGEQAIKQWFLERSDWIFSRHSRDGEGLMPVPLELRSEFLDFDGNPQTFRLVTKLQTSVANVGLGLTAATLAASLKYPIGARQQDSASKTRKKFGYFESEEIIVQWLRNETGLTEGDRHPLTWIMEACDDIAYSVLDVDDAMKKNVVSPDDVIELISSCNILNKSQAYIDIQGHFTKIRSAGHRPEIARDIKIGYLRATFISALIREASDKFIANGAAIFDFKYETPLMDGSDLCDKLKDVARQYAFGAPSVLRMEAKGAEAIHGLMSVFWNAIAQRKLHGDMTSRRTSPVSKYAYSLISPNYIEDAIRTHDAKDTAGSIRYRELRLLTDMISGMTDTFAIRLWQDIRQLDDVGTK